jgi:hypothetical protein
MYHMRSVSAGRKSASFSLGSGRFPGSSARRIASLELSGLRWFHVPVDVVGIGELAAVEEELASESAVVPEADAVADVSSTEAGPGCEVAMVCVPEN